MEKMVKRVKKGSNEDIVERVCEIWVVEICGHFKGLRIKWE